VSCSNTGDIVAAGWPTKAVMHRTQDSRCDQNVAFKFDLGFLCSLENAPSKCPPPSDPGRARFPEDGGTVDCLNAAFAPSKVKQDKSIYVLPPARPSSNVGPMR
jgi:hypothetical protein